jgi:hypothetical protein
MKIIQTFTGKNTILLPSNHEYMKNFRRDGKIISILTFFRIFAE